MPWCWKTSRTTEHAIRQLRDGMQAFAGLASVRPQQFTPENIARMQAMSERMTQMRRQIARCSRLLRSNWPR